MSAMSDCHQALLDQHAAARRDIARVVGLDLCDPVLTRFFGVFTTELVEMFAKCSGDDAMFAQMLQTSIAAWIRAVKDANR